jgi:hypothetical protein
MARFLRLTVEVQVPALAVMPGQLGCRLVALEQGVDQGGRLVRLPSGGELEDRAEVGAQLDQLLASPAAQLDGPA